MLIPMLKLRLSWDRLIFNMGMPMLVYDGSSITWIDSDFYSLNANLSAAQNNCPNVRRSFFTELLNIAGLEIYNRPAADVIRTGEGLQLIANTIARLVIIFSQHNMSKCHQPRLVNSTFHRQGRCSRGGHLCNEHSEEKYSCSYK